MSTVNAPFGLDAIWHPSGLVRPTAYTSTGTNDLLIPSGTNVSIFKGQPVQLVIGTGAAVNGVTITTGAMVIAPVTTTTNAVLGAFAGVEYVDATGKPWVSNYWPAGQTLLAGARQTVYVYDDPDIVYKVQADGAPSVAAGFALSGKQLNFSNFASGSTSTGLSQATASATVVATAAQGQLRIKKLLLDPTNLSTDTFPVFEVTIARHPFLNPATSL